MNEKVEKWTYISEPRESMGFPLLNIRNGSGFDLQSRHKFDAVYIPTNFSRGIISTDLELLRRYSRFLYIIPSEENKSALFDYVKSSGCKDARYLESSFCETDNLAYVYPEITQKKYKFEIHRKRNIALRHSKQNKFNNILLLDDDIGLTEENLCVSLELLTRGYDLVGFYVLDSPDISSINHIKHRLTKAPCQVSVGGNCLGLNVDAVRGFFPNVYNEDWLFIYGSNQYLSKAAAGVATQLDGNPWKNLDRVCFEQFGEVIASGMKTNMSNSLDPLSGDIDYWSCIIRKRLQDLTDLEDLSDGLDSEYSTAIKVAKTQIENIDAQNILDFINSYLEEVRR